MQSCTTSHKQTKSEWNDVIFNEVKFNYQNYNYFSIIIVFL